LAVDFPDDLGCSNPTDDDESNCGDGVCEGAETNVSCFDDCNIPDSLLVFVTNTTTSGFIANDPTDALDAADNICNNDAADNGHPGNYVVWLSTSTPLVNAKDRIIDGEYRNIFDQIIANNMSDLLDSSLDNPINPALSPASVWTGTNPQGTVAGNCNNWAGGEGSVGKGGNANFTTGGWTWFVSSGGCNVAKRLYCFQVS